MIELHVKPWGINGAKVQESAIIALLLRIGQQTVKVFKDGLSGPHSGVPGPVNQRSAPDEYPANQTGRLSSGTSYRMSSRRVVIGSTANHAVFMMGTTKMARRRMFDTAMKHVVPGALASMSPFATFTRS